MSEELKEELSLLPKGLLHLEAGIQSLREPVLEKSRRMGKLSDALDGLRFLCALPNMETHADLIAGLPLYHLHEIFEDVRTLAEYAAGEIQLSHSNCFPELKCAGGRKNQVSNIPSATIRSITNPRDQCQ